MAPLQATDSIETQTSNTSVSSAFSERTPQAECLPMGDLEEVVSLDDGWTCEQKEMDGDVSGGDYVPSFQLSPMSWTSEEPEEERRIDDLEQPPIDTAPTGQRKRKHNAICDSKKAIDEESFDYCSPPRTRYMVNTKEEIQQFLSSPSASESIRILEAKRRLLMQQYTSKSKTKIDTQTLVQTNSQHASADDDKKL